MSTNIIANPTLSRSVSTVPIFAPANSRQRMNTISEAARTFRRMLANWRIENLLLSFEDKSFKKVLAFVPSLSRQRFSFAAFCSVWLFQVNKSAGKYCEARLH